MTLAHLLDPSSPAPAPLEALAEGVPIFTSEHALSTDECRALLRRAEASAFEAAPITIGPNRFAMAPHIRDNTRWMFDDPALAEALWARLRHLLPDTPPERSRWRAIGLNERFRMYRYAPGQAFRWHRDGSFRRCADEQSFYTLILYLNGDFEGGCTEFPDASVRPRPGRALLFEHPLLHQGAPVVSGTKYVLRTDLMFSRAHGG